MKPDSESPDVHLPLLDLVRASAAMLVLFGHARGVLFEGIARVENPSIPVQVLYFLSGLQHEGVVLFFVISGFLVGGSVWRLAAEGRFDGGPYLVNRFVRIYLVYAPSILVVFAIDQIGQRFLADTRLYGATPYFPPGIFNGMTWSDAACHVVSLQGILCGAWGANPPLWSLGYEWLFYLAAPAIFVPLLMPKRRTVLRTTLPVVILGWLAWHNSEWLLWSGFWLLGVAAAQAFRTWPMAPAGGVAGVVLCAAGLVLSRLKLMPPAPTDMMVAFGLALALSSRSLGRIGDFQIVRRAAEFSYSLYVIHLPCCVFVAAIYERWFHWPPALVQPDLRGIAGFAGLVVVAVGAAWLFSLLTEKHTARARRWLRRVLLSRHA